MKAILLAIFCIAFATAQVVDLTPDNFDETIKGKNAFVEFFAPWCGHCKNLAPAYEVVGESFAKQKDVVIAKVDADAHKDLGSRFGVSGFPTLKWFPAGSSTPEDYNGGRSAEDIITFINNKAGTNVRVKKAPSNVVDLDDSNFDSIVLNPKKHVLAEFYAPWCGHCKHLAPDYEKVANAFAGDKDVVIAKLDADHYKDLAGRYGVSGFPTLIWFGKDNKAGDKYEKGRDVQSFVDFINEKAGTKRTASGKLQETAGRIDALDALAAKFSSGDKAALVKEAESSVKALSGDDKKNGEYYVKVMGFIQSKGADFVDSEVARLNKLMEGSVAASKVDEFTVKQNILKAFKA